MQRRFWQGGIGLVAILVAVLVFQLPRLSKTQSSQSGSVLGAATGLQEVRHPVLPPQLTTSDQPPLPNASAAVVIDGATGEIVIGKQSHDSLPIASTTKVMSTIVLLSSGQNLNNSVTVSEAAANQIGSVMGLQEGETLTARDLLTGALLVSGNDAIYALAEHAGGIPSFVAQMNAMAKKLDLADTEFLDPAGLEDSGHSSAFDLATMFRYALTFEDFRHIIATTETTVTSDQGISHHLQNSNRLIQTDQPLYLSQALGGKTGFTPDAGHTLVAGAQNNGHLLIAVVLHTDEESNDASAREVNRLLQWTFDNARWTE